jgi:hypothetical protein
MQTMVERLADLAGLAFGPKQRCPQCTFRPLHLSILRAWGGENLAGFNLERTREFQDLDESLIKLIKT